MKYRGKTSGSIGKAIGIGVLISITASLVMSMVLAWFVYTDRVGEGGTGYIIPAILFLSILSGCVVAGKLHKEKIGIIVGTTSATFLFLLIGSGILFFDSGFHNFVTYLFTTVLSSVVACAICISGKGKGTKRKRAYG